MSLAESIAPHLPYLRRYARALTGSQTEGDARVADLLRAVIADPSVFPQHLGPRIGLYRLFTRLSGPPRPAVPVEAPAWEAKARENLQALPPYPRQAFLLVAVEDFSAAEAATILDVDTHVFGHLLGVAGHELADQLRTEVLIIEDEPLIAMDLESLVGALGHRITGVARTRRDALFLARDDPPGLILADIQLADGSSGLDAVNEILADREVPVVFITAYPERLLTGLRPEPAFLVTKPFQTEMVEALIAQALFFDTRARLAPAEGRAG
ncbi:response regulator [Prosthecomicrobium sp. N25]|uniref:response regulator n=1 Tax=Prosthecomicrobium sp. N25 TaxID=3129254 RepID=UPI00307799D0